jgi:hypothetical protein
MVGRGDRRFASDHGLAEGIRGDPREMGGPATAIGSILM